MVGEMTTLNQVCVLRVLSSQGPYTVAILVLVISMHIAGFPSADALRLKW